MLDLLWLRQSGLEAAVIRAKEGGTVIFGICGGYQMLGRSISDPEGVEEGGSIRGLGLLPMDTVFAGEKTRTRVEGSFGSVGGVLERLSGAKVTGYELHMGQSFSEEILPLTFVTDRVTGERKSDGTYLDNVYGTYIHGVFDQEETAKEIIRALAARRGNRNRTEDTESGTETSRDVLYGSGIADYAAYRERQYEKLAETLRQHLDMDRIYEILEAGVSL